MKNQIYDKTLKTLFEVSLKEGNLLKDYRGEGTIIEQLDTVSKRPKELRIDFAQKIIPRNAQPYILHLEFQSKIDDDFPYRMLEYYEVLARKNKLEVEQILVYVGNPKIEPIVGNIAHKNLQLHYKVLDISQLAFSDLLSSNSPSEVIMAILANLRNNKPDEIVDLIFERLKQIAKNEDQLKDALYFLQILSDLRKFGTSISNKLKAMPISLDFRKSTLYSEGRSEGRQEGVEKVAFELYKTGADINFISKVTKLTLSYLKELFNIDTKKKK
jgi:hypothetical protein